MAVVAAMIFMVPVASRTGARQSAEHMLATSCGGRRLQCPPRMPVGLRCPAEGTGRVLRATAHALRPSRGMSLSSIEVEHRRAAFHIQHEPICDRCGHGASLHTLERSVPCIGCGERAAAGYSPRPACIGFTPDWFDNSRLVGRRS